MGLQRYNEKHDFRLTPEPRGRTRRGRGRELSFVVQKHAASHLHYDFRLELGGVLKSWAVPKGPSLDPADKRLAVEVEDHPLEYGGFEGVIPKGQYGGGSVLLWDRGTWEPLADPARGLERGKLEFTLHGEKLQGRWLLVRTRAGDRGKPQWLLRKVADERARQASDGGIVAERPESVETGRTIEQIGHRPARVWRSDRAESTRLRPAELGRARKAALPAFVEPQLATLVAEPPRGDGWLHELKLDGYRALCRVQGGKARFLTRRGNDWTDSFGRLASAAAFLPVESALLDGEVAWVDAEGHTDFQALQQALGDGRDDRLVYFAFDLLHLDGVDLTRAPLHERKELLSRLLATAPVEGDALRYSDHVAGHGESFFAQACRLGLEGIVAKRADAPYRGGRGTDWLKVKCLAEQELVIVGWTDPSGSREGLGALLLGVHEDGELRHVGKVGTGFDAATLKDLLRRLRPLERATAPVVNPPRGYKARGVHWVEPELVAQVAFTAWTADGVLRHPSFKGLRADKPASEVVREEPISPSRARKARPAAKAVSATKKKTKRVGATTKPAPSRGPSVARDGSVEVAGVRVSNPSRVLYPEQGLTKIELARYYERVADRILPHLSGRPLTLVRCPAGRDKHCFYQKHIAEDTPDTLVEVRVTERSGAEAVYVCVESLAGLVTLAQMGVLEVHPWGSRRDAIEKPDMLVFDLDPGPGVGWQEVIVAARELRDLLAELSLESFAKLSGGKGVHVVVPIVAELDWDPVKAFTKAVVQTLADRRPDRYVTQMAKAKRKGRIFLDYLRNGFGNTAVAPYSSRARPGAPVAAPIRWQELSPRLAPDRYTVRNMGRRLASLRDDPWQGYFELRQRLPPAVLERFGVR
jgi:bifunctional non-homologous end joining protein LigD